MTIFESAVLLAWIGLMVCRFVSAIVKNDYMEMVRYGFMIVAFVYLV